MPSADSPSVNTSLSLLQGVKARDAAAWRNLLTLYSPMVYRWARKAGLQGVDAQDIVQTVFLAVASDIDQFRRSRPGDSFRGWLWTVARHKILDCFREKQQRVLAVGGSSAQHRLQQLPDPKQDPGDARCECCRVRHRALTLIREHFEKRVWEAFLRTVVHGDRPTDVAADLGMSVATVYRSKVRVLTRLRNELAGL